MWKYREFTLKTKVVDLMPEVSVKSISLWVKTT